MGRLAFMVFLWSSNDALFRRCIWQSGDCAGIIESDRLWRTGKIDGTTVLYRLLLDHQFDSMEGVGTETMQTESIETDKVDTVVLWLRGK